MKSHRIRGGLVSGVAGLLLFILMFLPRFFNGGIALGLVLLFFVFWGVLDFLGATKLVTSSAIGESKAHSLPEDAPLWIRIFSRFNTRLLYLGIAFFIAGACRLSVIGTLGASAPWSGPLLFGVGLLIIIAAAVTKNRFDGDFHEGFLVVATATATIMATLGSHGLWDCWETHYGEVARRQLEQDDWISLFWEDKWFYSKPILIFWMMNLGMALFGVNIKPDSIPDHAEWGVRFLVAVVAIVVLWSIYQLLARRVSKRAGVLTALVLGTMPLYGFMTRQAITDLPFVGFMTLAVILFLFGITTDKDAQAKPLSITLWKNKQICLDASHGLLAGYVFIGLPQILYLASRSSYFIFGTLGHDDLKTVPATFRITKINLSNLMDSFLGYRLGGIVDLSLDWLIIGLLFGVPFFLLVRSVLKERRIARLSFHGMYLCLALSVMAKGLPGLALPILGLFGFWLIIVPWREVPNFKRFLAWHWDKAKRLELARGIPLFFIVASPWYVAMYVRHGMAFINRFFIHDHIKRLSTGVHGETGSLNYFLEQFGFAAYPWAAFFPLALLAWPAFARKMSDLQGAEAEMERNNRFIRLFFSSFALASFVLFSMMSTKFHHYVFPMLIPASVLIGLFLDDIWAGKVPKVGIVVLSAVVILTVVAMDMVVDPVNKEKGVLDGHTQLVGLFIYKYARPYPPGPEYDFSTPLLGFSILLGVSFMGWLWAKRRRVAMVITLFLAFAFSHFTNQHYMVQLAPHWTQKHLIQDYYSRRESSDERLIAFQMNWKGENFYTGNRVIPYVSTKNKEFEKWVDKHRGEQQFFITEQSRFTKMIRRTKPKSGTIKGLDDTCNKYRIGVAEEL